MRIGCDKNSALGLLHNRQDKIVPIAAFVVSLKSIAADSNGRAVSEVGKGAGGRSRRGVINRRKDSADWQHPRSIGAKDKMRRFRLSRRCDYLVRAGPFVL